MVQVRHIVALDVQLDAFALIDQRDQLVAFLSQFASRKPHLAEGTTHNLLKIDLVVVLEALNK